MDLDCLFENWKGQNNVSQRSLFHFEEGVFLTRITFPLFLFSLPLSFLFFNPSHSSSPLTFLLFPT